MLVTLILLAHLVLCTLTHLFFRQVPQPGIGLVSDTQNPVLSGASLTLTCFVELSPVVDIPVNITIMWTGPDGSTVISATPPVMKSLTHYTSKVKLNYVESADAGSYTCTVNIGDKIREAVKTTVIMGKLFSPSFFVIYYTLLNIIIKILINVIDKS